MATTHPGTHRYEATITNIYDGDTITADIDLGFGVYLTRQKLRLSGVRAPEVRGEDRERGLLTRNALREKIGDQRVTLETRNFEKGKYGRWLVTVYLREECLNEWLIDSGLAEPWA